MQLIALLLLHANVEGASNVTIFRELSNAGTSVRVIHPQGDVSADIGKTFAVNAGYEVDIVSGATPAVYGSASPDAVTGATQFSDTRQVARGGLSVNTALVGLSAAYSYGWESDYRSHTVMAAARGDFFDRNFTLGLAYTRNFDSVCDQNNEGAQGPLDLQPLTSSEHCFATDQTDVVSRSIAVHTFEPSLVWTATPRLLLQLGGTVQIIDGFQSNPYRRVAIGNQGRTPQEHLPTLRQRYASFLRARYAIPSLKAAVSTMARVYRDSWSLEAATVEAEVSKYLGSDLIVGVRGRYHVQSGAVFSRVASDYRTRGPAGQYWAGDRELFPLRTLVAGAKLSYLRRREQRPNAFFDEVELNIKFDLLSYHVDPGAPNEARKGGYIAQGGAALRF